MEANEQVDKARELILEWGGIDGGHHKQWLLDQVLRVLTQNGYAEILIEWEKGDEGPHTYSWDVGIAP